MIITYDNTQTVLNTSVATQELSLVSLETTITNITNKSFTVNLQITLNDSSVNVTQYGFLVSKSGVSLPEIGPFSHTNAIGETVYTYTYRLKDLISSQTYNILPYVTIDGNRTYDIQQQDVLTSIPVSLSSHTDMSYADIRDLDLSSKGLNMNVVNFDNCLVNENTIFSKNMTGLDIKHYYDYDLTNGFNFSVENGDNPNYDFVSLINSYSDNTIKNNLKLVRIKQLFRNREPQNMILVNKKFLGLVDTPTFYYSTYIGVLNPNINNFYLNDYMYPNEFKSEFCYKLITTNFTLNNSLNIVLNQNINQDEGGFRIIQKNNEFFWNRKIIVYIECMTEAPYRLTGNNLVFEVSFMSNLVDLYTDDLTFVVNIGNGDSVTVPFNKTNKSYFNYIPLNTGTFSLSINNNSFTRYQDVFDFTSTSYSTITVSENPNPVPVINQIYTNITNRSVTLGCDLVYSGNKVISEIGIYVSRSLPKSGTLYLIEETNLNIIKQYTRRIYPLLSNTTYYVIVYVKVSDGSTIETQTFEFTTKTTTFDISELTDLSYADLRTISLSSISEIVNLTGAIISVNTEFPLGKQYFDYPQTVLDELLSTDGTNNNTNKFIGVDDTEKNKIKKFLINQYFTHNNDSDFGLVSNKFLGIEDNAITPIVKIVNEDTKNVSISEVGSLKQVVLYKHMDENDEFELVDGVDTLKIQGPSGVSDEYFFYKNDVLIPKLDGIYTSGSIVDCFSSFSMLNGYVITLNSVEVAEYMYASLTGTSQAYYGDTITYTITLDTVTAHNLTFSLSDGNQIIILTGYTIGSVNKQLFAVQPVSITNVSGGQSNRVIFSGTVTCNIRNVTATLSTYNPTAYYKEEITYLVTMSYPINYLLTFQMDYGVTIPVLANQITGSATSIITENRNNVRLKSVSGPSGPSGPNEFITLSGAVSNTLINIVATLSCSNTTTYYGDTITYIVNLDRQTNENLEFNMNNDIKIPVLKNRKIGSANSIITENRLNKTLLSVSGPNGSSGPNEFVTLSGAVSTTLINTIATLSCSNTTAYYGDTITYIVNLDHPAYYQLTFTMDNGITIPVNSKQTRGSSNSIITENRIDKTLDYVSGSNGSSQFITLSGAVSTTLINTIATLSCSNTTAYYGDKITYFVYLDNQTKENLEFKMNNDITIPVLKNRKIGSANSIITENRLNKTLSSVSCPSGPSGPNEFITLSGAVSTTLINTIATLSCSNTTAYYGDTITYIVNLDRPAHSQLTFTMDNGITIPVNSKQTTGSANSIITENRLNKTLSGPSGPNEFITLSGAVSTTLINTIATLSCSNTTAYYGDTITYTVNLDRPAHSQLTFTLDNGITIPVNYKQTTGSSNSIITENGNNVRLLSAVSGPNGSGQFVTTLSGAVSTTLTNIIATLSCSNTTAYYGDTVTYTVNLDHPTRYLLSINAHSSVQIESFTFLIYPNQISASVPIIMSDKEGIRNVTITPISGSGYQFVTVSGSGTVSTVVDKEILIEDHVSRCEIIIPNVYISQDTEDTIDNDLSTSEKIITYLRELPGVVKSKVPTKGVYCLDYSSTVSGINTQYNYESNISFIHVKPSHITHNKASFQITTRSLPEYDAIAQMFVSGPNLSATISGSSISIEETNFIYSIESTQFQPSTNYNYTLTLFDGELITDTVSGIFKTGETPVIDEQTVSGAMSNYIKNMNNTIHLSYYYTITQNSKIINCMYKCFSSNVLTSISDTIYWEGSYEVARFSNEIIKYPLYNKTVEFNVVKAKGIYKDIIKVKIHFEDIKTGRDEKFHMIEFIK